MSTLTYQGKSIFYEINGTGEPLLILNGIMMSTKSWEPFVEAFSKNHMLLRLDFLDQGQSEKMNHFYSQDIQVDIIYALLESLGIDKINITGISYGGEIALLFAIKHQKMVNKLILFNTTAYTSPWLKEIGEQWIAVGKTRDGSTYYKTTIPIIYSPTFYENHLDWMKKREALLTPLFSNPNFLDQMERLTRSAEAFDVRKHLKDIHIPTLIVAGDEDYLTPIRDQHLLHELMPCSSMLIMPETGHASMYEKPMLFVSLILGFIQSQQTDFII